jgi:homoserine O-acetyltransferase
MNLALQSTDCPPQTVSPVGPPQVQDGVLSFPQPFQLSHGGVVEHARLAYRLEGVSDGPVMLVMGGISANRQVSGDAGWWGDLVGQGRVLNTRTHRILSIDWLGGWGDSTRAEDANFPLIDTRDQANAVVALLDHLGIDRLHGVIGASYGGLVAQQLARFHPLRCRRALILGAGHRPFPMAAAWRAVQRRILRDGARGGQLREATALARGLAMITYRSADEFSRRFGGDVRLEEGRASHPVEDYLAHCGEQFAERFGAWAYLRLSESIDLHQVAPERIDVPTDLVAFTDDQIAPLSQLREYKKRQGRQCRLWVVQTHHGHDGFLKEIPALRPIFARLTEASQETCSC